MKTKLKPCPFCGKQPTIFRAPDSWWRVQCWSAGKHMVGLYRKTKRGAVAAWNRRAKNA
jgi:hypothetical protein